MNYENTVYHLKCIRIMFDAMNEAITGKVIYSYYKKTLSRWIDEVFEAQSLVGLERVYTLKKELLQAYLSLAD